MKSCTQQRIFSSSTHKNGTSAISKAAKGVQTTFYDHNSTELETHGKSKYGYFKEDGWKCGDSLLSNSRRKAECTLN